MRGPGIDYTGRCNCLSELLPAMRIFPDHHYACNIRLIGKVKSALKCSDSMLSNALLLSKSSRWRIECVVSIVAVANRGFSVIRSEWRF